MVAGATTLKEIGRQNSLRLSDRLESDKPRGSSSPVTVTTATSSDTENSIRQQSRDTNDIISAMLGSDEDGLDSESRGSLEDNALRVHPRKHPVKNRASSLVVHSRGSIDALAAASEHNHKSRSMSVTSKGYESSTGCDTKKKKKFIKVRASDLGLDSASMHAATADRNMDTKQLESVVKRWKTEKGEDGDASVMTTETHRIARRSSIGCGAGRIGRAARRMSGAQQNRRRSVSRRRLSIGAKNTFDDEEVTYIDTDADEERVDPSSPYKPRAQRRASSRGRSRQDEDGKRRKSTRSRSRARKSPVRDRESVSDDNHNQAESTASENEVDSEVDEFGFVVTSLGGESSSGKDFQEFQQLPRSTGPRRGVLRTASFQEQDGQTPSTTRLRRGLGRSKSDDHMNFQNEILQCEEDERCSGSDAATKVLKTGIITKEQLQLLMEAGFRIMEAE